MAAGDIFTARIESIAAGGRGLCRVEGRAVFMALTAPGDTVTGRISAEHASWAEAELLELNEPSPQRREPACPYYGLCGGCSLQHIDYQAQLEIKKNLLTEHCNRSGLYPAAVTVEASPPWEYRNRLSFHVTRPGSPRAGLKARKSADIIPINDCIIADPAIRARLKEGAIRPSPALDRFTVYAKDGVFLSEAEESRGPVRLGGKTVTLDSGLFFQSNAAMLEKLLFCLREAAESAENRDLPLADLYAGVGTFSLFLADLFPGADLLEQEGAALELARHNLARHENAAAFRYYAQSDSDWVKRRGIQRRGQNYAFAVADPPRTGLSPLMARWLAEEGPPVLAYVSCNAASLARDSRVLSTAYRLERLDMFDFYPQTAHIESLAVFHRKTLY